MLAGSRTRNPESVAAYSRLRHFRLAVVVGLIVVLALPGYAEDDGRLSGPAIDQPCMECGVIYEIRPIKTERQLARTLEERAPPTGPFINIPLTSKPGAKPQAGVIGSREMRERLEETTYEIVERFDDGRYTLIRQDDATNLQVGDRVHIHRNRVEPVDWP
jgi:hypothetical protein